MAFESSVGIMEKINTEIKWENTEHTSSNLFAFGKFAESSRRKSRTCMALWELSTNLPKVSLH